MVISASFGPLEPIFLDFFQNTVMEMAENLPVDILAIKNIRSRSPRRLTQTEKLETLQELTLLDVFEKRLLAEEQIEALDKAELLKTFNDIVNLVNENAGEKGT